MLCVQPAKCKTTLPANLNLLSHRPVKLTPQFNISSGKSILIKVTTKLRL